VLWLSSGRCDVRTSKQSRREDSGCPIIQLADGKVMTETQPVKLPRINCLNGAYQIPIGLLGVALKTVSGQFSWPHDPKQDQRAKHA
jgi:hypothetical protein